MNHAVWLYVVFNANDGLLFAQISTYTQYNEDQECQRYEYE